MFSDEFNPSMMVAINKPNRSFDLQAKQKNITKGIRSIYRKTYLDNALAQQHMIAGDICLVTDDTLGIVINISVDDPDTLLDIKPEFNKFILVLVWRYQTHCK